MTRFNGWIYWVELNRFTDRRILYYYIIISVPDMSSYVLLPILGVPTVRGNECVNQTLFQTRVPAQPARWPGRPPPCCDALPRLLLRQLGFLKQSQTSDTEWRINNWYGTSSPLTTLQGVTISKWARATPCIPTEDFSDLNFVKLHCSPMWRENLCWYVKGSQVKWYITDYRWYGTYILWVTWTLGLGRQDCEVQVWQRIWWDGG